MLGPNELWRTVRRPARVADADVVAVDLVVAVAILHKHLLGAHAKVGDLALLTHVACFDGEGSVSARARAREGGRHDTRGPLAGVLRVCKPVALLASWQSVAHAR